MSGLTQGWMKSAFVWWEWWRRGDWWNREAAPHPRLSVPVKPSTYSPKLHIFHGGADGGGTEAQASQAQDVSEKPGPSHPKVFSSWPPSTLGGNCRAEKSLQGGFLHCTHWVLRASRREHRFHCNWYGWLVPRHDHRPQFRVWVAPSFSPLGLWAKVLEPSGCLKIEAVPQADG